MEFNPETDIPDLTGKVVLVTGGNVGLGAAIIEWLAPRKPSAIYLLARRIESAKQLVAYIKQSNPDVNIIIIPFELSSFDSIKKCAAEFNEKTDRLDLLFLNAGISSTLPTLTDDGYESQFGINHMGHALLTQLLMPTLLQTAHHGGDPRIMITSSMAVHRDPPPGGLVLNQMKEPGPLSGPYQRYAHSKLANILFARKLAQAYPAITSTSWDPGQVHTELMGKATGIPRWVLYLIAYPMQWLTAVSAREGAKGGLWTAFGKDLRNGAYYEPVGKLAESYDYICDQNLTDELWDWTEKELAVHEGPGWPQA
ncbi:hypothetical protein F5884DRAFT_814169 [Xylogone sp. PMI_703]|nr:hypothetical protein F5884DRAFT_814169 [Xylogone sp. PMI_703]